VTPDLITKLEQVQEGSWDLDFEIARVVYGQMENQPDVVRLPDGPPLPHFTTSLDAALTLVPDGYRWMVGIMDKAGEYFCACQPDELTDAGFDGTANCPTPALALCVAALKSAALKARE